MDLEERMAARRKKKPKRRGAFGVAVNTQDPAYSIVRKLGGTRAVAAYLGISAAAVSRWSTAKTLKHPKGGAGHVPETHRNELIKMARIRRVRLSVLDF